jgi:hypothetical protein
VSNQNSIGFTPVANAAQEPQAHQQSPYYKEAYREQLDKAQWGLIEVAQLATYKGTIWATWDKATPPFLDYLGEMQVYLDTLLDCRDGRDGGSEVLGGMSKRTSSSAMKNGNGAWGRERVSRAPSPSGIREGP